MIPIKRIFVLVTILVVIAAAGTAGFALTEGYGPLDAFFTTVVLISTVGLGTAPASAAGKVLAIVLIIVGVGTLVYAFSTVIEFFMEGYLGEMLEERGMKKKVAELSNHFVICGYGRVGEQVAREFTRAGEVFVVVDSSPESIARCKEHGLLFVEGDAADDETLSAAGLHRAQGLVACVDSDADNVFVTLSARVMAPDLRIVARANLEDSYSKLKKAGADKVISPYAIGGREMATLMRKPLVSDYLDVVTGGGELELRVEQFTLSEGSPAIGRSIKDLEVRRRTGAIILAARKPGGAFDTNPEPDTTLSNEDTIIAVGAPDEIQSLESLLAPATGTAAGSGDA
ncbi:MAG: potassium channel family protein [Thermoleophilia bacterium]